MTLNPPIRPSTTPSVKKNIVIWESGPPNEYFSGDLSDWTAIKTLGTETATIENGNLRLTIPSNGEIKYKYNYQIPSGDCIVDIDFSVMIGVPEDPSGDFFIYFIAQDLNGSMDLIRTSYWETSFGHWSQESWLINGVYTSPVHYNIANKPTKFRFKRVGNILSLWQYMGSSWIQRTSQNFGIYASNITHIALRVTPSWPNNYGGYAEFDNLTIISGKSYFPNDTFKNLDNWIVSDGNNSTISIDSGKVLCDLEEGFDSDANILSYYSFPQGDFELTVDTLDFSPDHTDGFSVYFTIQNGNIDNQFRINCYNIATGIRIRSIINGGSEAFGSWQSIGSFPSKLRITRIGTILYGYYYISSWVLIGSIDFGSYANELIFPFFAIYDRNLHGGSIKLDNFILDSGVNSYNLYWKKDKCPNCYFVSLDDWSITTNNSSTTIINEKAKFDLIDYTDSYAAGIYDYLINSGNFVLEIDIDYNPDNTTDGFACEIQIRNTIESPLHKVVVLFQVINSTYIGKASWLVNSVLTDTGNIDTSGTIEKIRISRTGTIVSVNYYNSGSWHVLGNKDFGSYASELNIIKLNTYDRVTRGGYVTYDNLIITPSVKNSGTKISNIIDLTYDHESLIPGDVYCYEITAEGSESEPSEETYGIPDPLNPPTGISVVSGEGKNIITFTVNPGADKTHAYWDTSPGFTPSGEQKLSDITSPHDHEDLNPSLTYYYILVSEDEYGEGSYSSEYSSSPIPTAPENLIVTPGIQKNTITWNVVEGADSYNIYWKISSPVTKLNGTKITDVTSPCEHISLTPGQIIYYVITSEDEDGESNISGEQSGIPLLPAPTGIVATAVGERNIEISWNGVTGATKYNIYWKTTTGVTKENGTKISDVSSPYTHSDLIPDQEYFYIVTAENANDESIDSSEVSDTAVIDAVVILSITGGDSENIIVWNMSDAVDSYNIYYSTEEGFITEDGTKIENVTSPYTHIELTRQIYYYIVVPVINSVEHTESDENSAIPLFEGKIFNHIEQIKNSLLYQYQGD